MKTGFAYLLAGVVLIGCSKKNAPVPTAPSGGADSPAATAEAAEFPNKDPKKASIRISDRIKEACGLTDTDAYFEFDSAKISPAADAVLTKLAECFTTGPLKEENMKLVGHADPRGSEEYNLALGGDRAENVKSVLGSKGLAGDRATTTSRGELEATGTDEATWAQDRRVDVKIDE